MTNVTSERLTSLIERIERLEEEKAVYASDIKDIYAEAKGEGYDIKAMKQLVKLRKMDRQSRAEMEEMSALYKAAVGMD